MTGHGQTARPPRGHRQRQRTRSALLLAGQRLFAAQSPEGVSIDDIVQDADVSKGSFYNHFDDKHEFAAAIRGLIQGHLEVHVTSANRDVVDPAQRLVRALCVVTQYALDHPDRLQTLISLAGRGTAADSPLNAGVSDDVRRGLETGRLRAPDLESGVLAVIGLTLIAVRHVMSDTSEKAPAKLASSMGTILLQSLGTPAEEGARLAADAAAAIIRNARPGAATDEPAF